VWRRVTVAAPWSWKKMEEMGDGTGASSLMDVSLHSGRKRPSRDGSCRRRCRGKVALRVRHSGEWREWKWGEKSLLPRLVSGAAR
jgi:hypothetical protein